MDFSRLAMFTGLMTDHQHDFHLVERAGWTLGQFHAMEALGLPHAVSTRMGPDIMRVRSEPQWGAEQLAGRLGLPQVAWLDQIHSGIVIPVRGGGLAGKGDGLVTAEPSVGLVGRSADCPLILLADVKSGVVGMAHASWRGTVQRIAVELVKSAAALGAKPERMIACICPSAGPCCYEVGADVLASAVGGIGEDARDFFTPRGDRFLLDLWSANRRQLETSGLSADNIHVAGVCTLCHNDVYPSHRREGDRAGRFMAILAATKNGATKNGDT